MALYSALSDFAVNLLTAGTFLRAKVNGAIKVGICLGTINAVFGKESSNIMPYDNIGKLSLICFVICTKTFVCEGI